MKKEFVLYLFAFLFAISLSSAYIGECSLDVSLLNQDPVHAVPGEYVKIVFQLEGVDNPQCGTVSFNLVQEYPFSLDPSASGEKIITTGTFTDSYNSQATIPYSIRVDKDALDKEYELKVRYSTNKDGGNVIYEKTFNIPVEDVKVDFDVFVDDYQAATSTITFNILNIGKNDVEALTVEIPKQESIIVKGSNKAIVGTLDSNQDTTFSYEAFPQDGEMKVVINYNDANGERRSVEKVVLYDSSYFTDRARDAKSTSPFTYLVILVIIILVIWFIKRKFFPKKDKEKGR